MKEPAAPPVPPLAVLSLGVVAMSTGAIFARMAEAEPLAISFWRCAIAALALAPLGAPRAPRELASLYLVAGRRLRERMSFATYAALCYGLAALVLLALALLAGTPLTGFEGETWLWLALCGLVPQLIGHSSANWALRWATSTLVAVSLLGEPIASTLLALVVLGEVPEAGFLAGAPLLLGGILVTARAERRA